LAAGADDEARSAAKAALDDVRGYLQHIGTTEHRLMFLDGAPGAEDTLSLGRELGLDVPTA
jgi:hypothetical protein